MGHLPRRYAAPDLPTRSRVKGHWAMSDPARDALVHLLTTWDDVDTLDALDALDATTRFMVDADEPRTDDERAAERAARDDWERSGTTR